MAEREKTALTSDFREQLFKLGVDNIKADTAMLARSMVVMRREYLTELDLTFEAVPDAVNDTEFLEEHNSAVSCSSIDLRCARFCKLCRGRRAAFLELFEDNLSRLGVAVAGVF